MPTGAYPIPGAAQPTPEELALSAAWTATRAQGPWLLARIQSADRDILALQVQLGQHASLLATLLDATGLTLGQAVAEANMHANQV